MRSVKPTEKTYISFFKNYEVILTLKKKKSPVSVLFCTDDKNKWFINKVTYLNKSGEIHDNCLIIAKDLPNFINFYESDGFYKV